MVNPPLINLLSSTAFLKLLYAACLDTKLFLAISEYGGSSSLVSEQPPLPAIFMYRLLMDLLLQLILNSPLTQVKCRLPHRDEALQAKLPTSSQVWELIFSTEIYIISRFYSSIFPYCLATDYKSLLPG